MQIFALDDHPCVSARMLCDKHVISQVKESAQLLCTVARKRNFDDVLYKLCQPNHPAVKWAEATYINWMWLLWHGFTLAREYSSRYAGKTHASERVLVDLDLKRYQIWPGTGTFDTSTLKDHTPFAQIMPEVYQGPDPIEAYRKFYIGEKARFARWNKTRQQPDWWPTNMEVNLIKALPSTNISVPSKTPAQDLT